MHACIPRRIVSSFFSLCRKFDLPISCITKDSSTIEELGEKHNLYKVRAALQDTLVSVEYFVRSFHGSWFIFLM